MEQSKFDAQTMLERTIHNIEERYPDEINKCMQQIKEAADDCKFSAKIELTPACAGTMKKYFMYKGYNAKLTGSTLELAWNVNFDGTDVNNILKDRTLLRAFI
jgi:hypothetical protein